MATVTVNGCGEGTKDGPSVNDRDNIVNCKVTQNHVGDNGETSIAQSSHANNQDVTLVNHKSMSEDLADIESGETKISGTKNLNGTNDQDSFTEENVDKTGEEDKYSGFGIRPHNADDKENSDEEMDSPPRMVFSLAGFAPLNEQKEKEDVKTSEIEMKDDQEEEKETMDTDKTENIEVDNDVEMIDNNKDQESSKVMDSKMDFPQNDKEDVKGNEILDQESDKIELDKDDCLEKDKVEHVDDTDDKVDKMNQVMSEIEKSDKVDNLDVDINESSLDGKSKNMKNSDSVESLRDKSGERVDEVNNSLKDNKSTCSDDEKVDSMIEKETKDEVKKDGNTDESSDSKIDNNLGDKTEKENTSEIKETVNDDSLVDNEGCSDREDKQDADNDSIFILDEDGDNIEKSKTEIESKNGQSSVNKHDDKRDKNYVKKDKSDLLDGKKEHLEAEKSKDGNKGSKSVEKVIIDGSEIVITINEDESGDDSGKDADDESDDDDEDNKERKKKLHNKISPTKPQTSQDTNKNNSADNDVVVLDGSLPKDKGSTVLAPKHIVMPSSSKTVIAVPSGLVSSNTTNRQYILPASTSQTPSTVQPAAGSQYFKVMGQKQQTFYMPISSQYIISNSTGQNQSLVANAGQPLTVAVASQEKKSLLSQPPTASSGKSGSGSILTDKIDEDVASSSWEQLELVKYDIAMRKPDNTFWMGLANVNKKAEISSVTKFLFDLGSDIVKESAYRQIINVQNKKLDSGKLNKSEIESLEKMKSVVKDLKEKVGFLDLKQTRCKGCGFQTSSKTVMNMHKEYPHMTPPYDMYGVLNCVHCDFNTKIPTNYTYHMNAEHNMTGRVYDKPALHQCNLCQFESNAKPKLTQHRGKCTKNYKPHLNQAPYHFDINYCLKNIFYKFQIKKPPQPKPDTRTKVIPSKPPIIQPKNVRSPVFTQPARPQVGGRFVLGPNQNVYRLNLPNQSQYHQQFQQFALTPSGQRPGYIQHPISNKSANMPFTKQTPRPNQPYKAAQFAGKPTVGELLKQKNALVNSSVAPASRPQLQPRPQAVSPQSNNQGNAGGFEVCEMCGGYVKDKMSLRIHFYYAHKIDMPASVFNRANAPLCCEVCKKRFWTTQGLTKHKQSMKHNYTSKPNTPTVPQNQAMCWICHQKPDNLYSHLHKFHRLTTSECMGLKRCMFCGTLCSTRKELEIHMAAAHGVLIKGEGGPVTPNSKPAVSSNIAKPAAGVSVSTRTVVTGTGSKSNPALVRNNFCVFCAKQFSDNTQLTLHCLRDHATCSGCGMVVAKASDLKSHVCKVNRSRSCEICGIKNLKSVYYTKHVSSHLKKCRVKVKRLSQGEIAAAVKRKKSPIADARENIEIISDSQSDEDIPAEKVIKLEKNSDVEMKSDQDKNKKDADSNADKTKTVKEEVKEEKEMDTEQKSSQEANSDLTKEKGGSAYSDVKEERVESANSDMAEEKAESTSDTKEEKVESSNSDTKEERVENANIDINAEKVESASADLEKEKVETVNKTEDDEDKSSRNKRKSEDEGDDESDDVQSRKRLRSTDKKD